MNSDIIRLLPDSVANQIAAGEVIQRPASVIKELVENSVDAGATSITIVLKDAGRTLIQVIDNGSGMSPTDARMAFERHATSKISSADDLYRLHTMGFRGEALPSIAAVSQIDLRTMREGDSIGTRLQLSESVFEAQEPVTCVRGTNLSVKNIFFHMPARRKFLKKDSVELGHILREFERLALVNTDIDFTLIHNDVVLHKFPKGTFKQRISALFGKSMESQIAEIATETSLVKIGGFIGMPRFAKKRGYNQFFFVNGRNMRHPMFHRGVMECYSQLIPTDSQPSYFINFEVDPSTIDVNIHPQKHEIKFEHEQAIFQILTAAVKETLGRNQANGALDFDSEFAPEIPLFQPDTGVEMPDENYDKDYNPFRAASDNNTVSAPWTPKSAPIHDWDKLYDSFSRKREDAFTTAPEPDIEADIFGDLRSASDNEAGAVQQTAGMPCFQFQNRYIVTPSHNGLTVISQNRAHVRILYDRFMDQLSRGAIPSQQLIFSEPIELSPSRAAVMEGLGGYLREMGFILEHSEGPVWNLVSVPSAMNSSRAVEALTVLLDDYDSDNLPSPANLRGPVALALARSAAIRGGAVLTPAEMESIVADLFRCKEPSFTPDGLPVLTVIGNDELSSRFTV